LEYLTHGISPALGIFIYKDAFLLSPYSFCSSSASDCFDEISCGAIDFFLDIEPLEHGIT